MFRSARHELALVIAFAVCGLALVLVVVFAPWYSPAAGGSAPDVRPPHIEQVTDTTPETAVLTR